MTLMPISLDDKYEVETGRVFLTGIQALVRLPMMQHVLDARAGLNTAGFISGYRGSPLGGLDQQLWRAQKLLEDARHRLQAGPQRGPGRHRGLGHASRPTVSPAQATTACSACGTARRPASTARGDAFKHANYAGNLAKGGVLAIAGDDHACKSSTLPAPERVRLRRRRDAGARSGRHAGGARFRPLRLGDVALLRAAGSDDRAGRDDGQHAPRSTSIPNRASDRPARPASQCRPAASDIRWPDHAAATRSGGCAISSCRRRWPSPVPIGSTASMIDGAAPRGSASSTAARPISTCARRWAIWASARPEAAALGIAPLQGGHDLADRADRRARFRPRPRGSPGGRGKARR